ncbi:MULTISPECIES: flavin-containing monooxygenase [Mycolicibacterium]|uniref:Cyclohexanone monooxygenase n=2 Tax=Mycolicibacterium TaxID=1866885 RepID=A1T2Q4_MYCVP|nr:MULTISPECIES: NAD(P)/FAD-dependent oxidoreductase [Mycolicibacterium]ABM11454.1 Cyclohexanone monooxygenase [Mycolicibacterium vanbaalenii PYR-1]MCV7127804.1 NAD(P)/FAD-dependent oxidoreductase [Mycolicibacterium vanbaalenii PYR-1]MDN4519161.1 NAD(P)/FAD-dependent oxidoreductase [Mycolicibacterium austroafricanum]MDW5612472.1 NAD(P)/FAD-dependent oxidoreductase [Mycolicibacterium sp. D5.8-2]PQP44899.1 NAD(P)/FAD-dependent oxidoreductase [Mycolicibacterium austroafricanum]
MTTPTGHAQRVAIIGAGFSGLAAAIALRQRGIEDFVIFEQSEGIGGTWWFNRYPGAEVDLESHVYSFSYARSDWTRTHVGWQELQEYLERVAYDWDLPRRIRFNEKVVDVRWSDEKQTHTVTTSSGADHGEFTAVISAVGFLNIPLVPPFAREDNDFQGAMCHTSAWIDGLDLTGKSVGVVGTGSSAVQVVTEAEKVAGDVTIFQLEPNWIVPKHSRAFTPLERRLNKLRPVYAWRRWALYFDYDRRQLRSSHARSTGRFNRRRHQASLEFMRRELAGRPDLLEKVTPTFAFEGKRTVCSDTYYASLRSPKVTLVPHALKGLTRTGAVDANGDEHDLDVIVLATGFDAANYLGNYQVYGQGGRELHSAWQGEPEAFLGMMVPGFPNFFIMYGPNTNSVPLVHFYEAQADFAASLIKRAAKTGHRVIDVRRSAFVIYNDWLQAQLAKTVWARTSNYFRAGTGKVVSQWPFGATPYILATKLLRRIAVRLT